MIYRCISPVQLIISHEYIFLIFLHNFFDIFYINGISCTQHPLLSHFARIAFNNFLLFKENILLYLAPIFDMDFHQNICRDFLWHLHLSDLNICESVDRRYLLQKPSYPLNVEQSILSRKVGDHYLLLLVSLGFYY